MAAPQIESVLAPATADSGSSINIDVTAIDPAALTVTWTATATNTVTNYKPCSNLMCRLS